MGFTSDVFDVLLQRRRRRLDEARMKERAAGDQLLSHALYAGTLS